jgi:hypothetical protein
MACEAFDNVAPPDGLPRDRGFVNRTRRTGLTLLSAVSIVLLTAGPALADRNPLGPREGADPGDSLSWAATIGLFVVIPLGFIALLSAIVLLPGMVRGSRYRPTKGWDAAPVWFAGPLDPSAAVANAQVGDDVRGGGSGSW